MDGNGNGEELAVQWGIVLEAGEYGHIQAVVLKSGPLTSFLPVIFSL